MNDYDNLARECLDRLDQYAVEVYSTTADNNTVHIINCMKHATKAIVFAILYLKPKEK